MAKRGTRREDAPREAKPAPRMPVWLKRAICFAGAALLAWFAASTCYVMVIQRAGIQIGIVGTIVFAVMAVHLVRAGLADGSWRVER